MSAVALHVITAMIVQVAKVTTFPFSFDKINFDHRSYEPKDNHKVIIKLKTLNTEKWVEFMLCVS